MEYYFYFIGDDPTHHMSIHGLKLKMQRYNSQFPAKLLAAPTRRQRMASVKTLKEKVLGGPGVGV